MVAMLASVIGHWKMPRIHGQTGPPDCLALARWAGPSAIQVGRHVTCSSRLTWEVCLRNDLHCVGWGVKLYSLTHPVGSEGEKRSLAEEV